ncbi:hypothetical protein C8R45DRAFT_1097472 [Mycena sanguinolenta]|nr:hypothetical protein C8R45DRAFT_1097472 [Mycena sanguinolenta]
MKGRHVKRLAGQTTDSSSSLQHVYSVDEVAGPEDQPVPAFVHRVSEDRWCVYVEELAVEPPLPVKCMWREAVNLTVPPGNTIADFEMGDFSHSFSLDGEHYKLAGFNDDKPVRALSPERGTHVVKP